MRFYQFFPELARSAISVDVSPLLADGYVDSIYCGRRSWRSVYRGYLRRARALLNASKYDVIWLEKEALPYVPRWLERLLTRGNVPILVDYDDAVFHQYDQHDLGVVRKLFGSKIDSVMEDAALVTVGNDYLAARARSAGAVRVEWLPTVVDLADFPCQESPRTDSRVIIGWIGSPATAAYLRMLSEPLVNLSHQMPIHCVAVGARPDQTAGTMFEAWPWSKETEAASLARFDIGIMPLPDEPWERGKCGFKLIQYMASGLPVIASPVGVNVDIVKNGKNGFLASNAAEWVAALALLSQDPDLRARMGKHGRTLVESTYNTQVQGSRLARMLPVVAGKGI